MNISLARATGQSWQMYLAGFTLTTTIPRTSDPDAIANTMPSPIPDTMLSCGKDSDSSDYADVGVNTVSISNPLVSVSSAPLNMPVNEVRWRMLRQPPLMVMFLLKPYHNNSHDSEIVI